MVAAARPGGFVSAHELYTLKEIDLRLGLGTAALRTARRRGLRIAQIGRSKFVLGSDLIDHINTYNEPSRPSAANTQPALTTLQPCEGGSHHG